MGATKTAVVLKAFNLVADDRGITANPVAIDDVVEVPAELFSGLKAEGFIRAYDAKKDGKTAPKVDPGQGAATDPGKGANNDPAQGNGNPAQAGAGAAGDGGDKK